MTEEQIDKLFAAMSGLDDKVERIASNISSLDQKVSIMQEHIATQVATMQQVNAVYDLLDKNVSEHQRQEEERAAMAHQLDRLTKWAETVATKTGVPLPF